MRVFLVLIIWIFIQETVFAQALVDSSFTLEELVVTAQRSAKPRLASTDAIEVLHQKHIQSRQMRSAPEAIALLPGVFVQKTNHGGGSPMLRGLTGNQTLLLMDGIRLNNATYRYGPNQYFNTIDLFSLEKIEVLRGSGAVQYGSDALGGVIQTFSRELSFSEKSDLGGALLFRGATQGMEQTVRAELQHSTKRTAFGGGLSWRNFGDLVGGQSTGRQTPSGYREFDFDFKGRIALSKNTSLTLLHQSVRQNEVPVFHKIQLEDFVLNQFEPQGRNLSYGRLEHLIQKGIWKSISITGSYQSSEEGRKSRKLGSSLLRFERDRVKTLGANIQITNTFGKLWTSNSGLEIYRDLVGSTRSDTDLSNGQSTAKRGLYPNHANMLNLAVFSLHEWEYKRWYFTAGLRWNTFKIQVKEEAIGLAKLSPSALVGNAAISYKFNGHANLFCSINTGFRAPNIDDLSSLGIVDFRFETPNYALRPEHSTQIQIGYKWKKNRLLVEAYLYRNELRNLITRIRQDTQTVQGYPLYQKENSAEGNIQGIETNGTYAIARNWSAQGSLTYTRGQNVSANEPMRRIPPMFGRLALGYSPRNWSFEAEFLAARKQDRLAKGDMEDNRIPKGGTPGWQVLNLHAGFAWGLFNLRLTALNLFNEDYRTHGSGLNGVGRSLFATVSVRF